VSKPILVTKVQDGCIKLMPNDAFRELATMTCYNAYKQAWPYIVEEYVAAYPVREVIEFIPMPEGLSTDQKWIFVMGVAAQSEEMLECIVYSYSQFRFCRSELQGLVGAYIQQGNALARESIKEAIARIRQRCVINSSSLD